MQTPILSWRQTPSDARGEVAFIMSNPQLRPQIPVRAAPLSEQEAAFEWVTNEDYDSNRFLDRLIVRMSLENDAALARELQVDKRIISMLRKGSLSMGIPMLVLIHSVTGMDAQELRDLLAVRQRY